MTRLLCVGHGALDAIYRVPTIPTTPTKVLARCYIETGGGTAANASFAARRLGAEVQYWGRVGDDAVGARISFGARCGGHRRNNGPLHFRRQVFSAPRLTLASDSLAIGEGLTVVGAARFANAAAALKCTRWGGRHGAPTRAEGESFLSAGT